MGLGLFLGFVGYVVLDLAWAQHVGTAVVLAAVVALAASVWARRPRR